MSEQEAKEMWRHGVAKSRFYCNRQGLDVVAGTHTGPTLGRFSLRFQWHQPWLGVRRADFRPFYPAVIWCIQIIPCLSLQICTKGKFKSPEAAMDECHRLHEIARNALDTASSLMGFVEEEIASMETNQ